MRTVSWLHLTFALKPVGSLFGINFSCSFIYLKSQNFACFVVYKEDLRPVQRENKERRKGQSSKNLF